MCTMVVLSSKIITNCLTHFVTDSGQNLHGSRISESDSTDQHNDDIEQDSKYSLFVAEDQGIFVSRNRKMVKLQPPCFQGDERKWSEEKNQKMMAIN